MGDMEEKLLSGLKMILKEKNWTQRELSKRTDIPYRSIQNYLTGTTKMPATVYLKICKELGVDNQYVLHGSFQLFQPILHEAVSEVIGENLVLHQTTDGVISTSQKNTKLTEFQLSELTHNLLMAYARIRKQYLTTDM